MSALGVCKGCKRFAREAVCPFCGADVGAPRSKQQSGRRARNSVLALAITAACGGVTTAVGGGNDASTDAAASDAASSADAKEDMAPIPFYGAAPFDSGTDGGMKDSSEGG